MARVLIFLFLISCGHKEVKVEKGESVVGSWLNTTKVCEGIKCNCTNFLSFYPDGTFSGYERCDINGKLSSGEYGGIYEYKNSRVRMDYYDGRGEAYTFLRVYKNRIDMIVGNKIKVYLKTNLESRVLP